MGAAGPEGGGCAGSPASCARSSPVLPELPGAPYRDREPGCALPGARSPGVFGARCLGASGGCCGRVQPRAGVLPPGTGTGGVPCAGGQGKASAPINRPARCGPEVLLASSGPRLGWGLLCPFPVDALRVPAEPPPSLPAPLGSRRRGCGGTAWPQLCSPPRAQLHPGLPAQPGGGFSLPPSPFHLGQGSWLSTGAQEGSQQSRSQPPALPGVKAQQRQRSKCSGFCCAGGAVGWCGLAPAGCPAPAKCLLSSHFCALH